MCRVKPSEYPIRSTLGKPILLRQQGYATIDNRLYNLYKKIIIKLKKYKNNMMNRRYIN
jgi:hypothetical protein